jgi:hypothetical protein
MAAKVVSPGQLFGDITFIQRLDTKGGAAPESDCNANTAVKQVSVPYSARYDFFRGQ